MSKFTNAEKQTEAEREVRMRQQVYSASGSRPLTTAQKRQIAMMEEIAAEYRALADRDRLL